MVETARLLLPKDDVTTKEIELWVKHIGPVWKGPMDWMKTALINWNQEMRDNGLTDDDMEGFVRGASSAGSREPHD
jgi:hypothetical protein